MKIIFYTSGTAGSGRLIRGIAIGNALKRANFKGEFVILSSSSFSFLAEQFEIKHQYITIEDEKQLSKDNYQRSKLYQALLDLKPDILIVDLLWFSLCNFIDELSCRKIFLCHRVIPQFFKIDLPGQALKFDPAQYDELFSIEPFESDYNFKNINPLILKNRDEILGREEALQKLNLSGDKQIALFAINARPGDFKEFKKKYTYLEDVGWDVVYTTNYQGGLFPVIDYFNAFDMIICLAGYNQFWECLYFDKESVFETIPLNFCSMQSRIDDCAGYQFEINGADELVNIILK